MIPTEIAWQVKTDKPFINVSYGRTFQEKSMSILAGGEDGIVRVYSVPNKKSYAVEPVRTLETKCGPIFHVKQHNVIRLSSQEIIVADSRGSVAVFCNGQMFMRTRPEKASGITALQITETGFGHLNIITGNEDGVINCFNAFAHLWKIKLHDLLNEKVQNFQPTLSVTSIIACSISSASCPAMDYVVVADSDCHLHFIQDGTVHLTISTPAVAQDMAVGHFLHYDNSSESNELLTQIALGCNDGSIWICVDFEIQSEAQYADVGHPITHLHQLPPPSVSHVDGSGQSSKPTQSPSSELDLLLCAGYFKELLVLREGKVMTKHPLSDWPNSICKFWEKPEEENSDSEESNMVLVGCQDSTLRAIRVT